jgi:pSer/pThr/pTyr-binding forkhead associated (FHA) protein
MVAPPAAGATQMGQTIACAVCSSNNPALEPYCIECGFLLASVPGTAESAVDSGSDTALSEFALIEDKSGRQFRLSPGDNVVGRENADVLLMDGTVSRRHAQVTLNEGVVTATDLGSTNGTQVDGVKLAPNVATLVSPGASVSFGHSSLTLSAPGAPAEATIVVPVESLEPAESTLAVAVEAPPDAVTEEAVLSESAAVEEPSLEEAPAAEAAADKIPIGNLVPTAAGAQTIALYSGLITVGRRAGNDVVIDNDPYVSGKHAEVLCDSSGCYITDIGSTNGTLVNGKRLEAGQKEMLLNGDEVAFGQSAYVYESAAIAVPAEEEAAPVDSAVGLPDLAEGEVA